MYRLCVDLSGQNKVIILIINLNMIYIFFFSFFLQRLCFLRQNSWLVPVINIRGTISQKVDPVTPNLEEEEEVIQHCSNTFRFVSTVSFPLNNLTVSYNAEVQATQNSHHISTDIIDCLPHIDI